MSMPSRFQSLSFWRSWRVHSKCWWGAWQNGAANLEIVTWNLETEKLDWIGDSRTLRWRQLKRGDGQRWHLSIIALIPASVAYLWSRPWRQNILRSSWKLKLDNNKYCQGFLFYFVNHLLGCQGEGCRARL
jgi:hypothetical protein